MPIKETKLFIENDKKNNIYNVLISVGPFRSKEEAVHYASYICITKSIDFNPDSILGNITELEDIYYGKDNKTLH